MTFAERLKSARKQRGVSKSQLAALARVGRGHFTQIEEGRIKNPTVDVAQRLAGALGMPVQDLLGVAMPIPGSIGEQLEGIPANLAAALFEARRVLSESRFERLIGTVLSIIALSMCDEKRGETVPEPGKA